MTLMEFERLLGWCILLNSSLLIWWFLFLVFAKGWVYRTQSRWFRISESRFFEIHYGAFVAFKLAIFMLMVVPYLALKIVF